MATGSTYRFCDGTGQVSSSVDDVAFTFHCVCVGGNEEAVRWLLGTQEQSPLADDTWTD